MSDNSNEFNIKDRKQSYKKQIPIGAVALILYLLHGFVWGLWHPLWLVFLLVPVIDSIIEAFEHKNIRKFNIVMFVTVMYLFTGFYFGWWHPAWVSFFAIPLFYLAF